MTRKTAFFEVWSWFKFNNLGLALGTNLKFYTSLSKGLKLKVRKFWRLIPTIVEVTEEKLVLKLKVRIFWGLIPTFVEVTEEKLVVGPFCPLPPSWIGLRSRHEFFLHNISLNWLSYFDKWCSISLGMF